MGSENGERVWPLERAGTPSIVKGGDGHCWQVGLLEGRKAWEIELLLSEVEPESQATTPGDAVPFLVVSKEACVMLCIRAYQTLMGSQIT